MTLDRYVIYARALGGFRPLELKRLMCQWCKDFHMKMCFTSTLISIQIKHIFIWNVLHQDAFWNKSERPLGNWRIPYSWHHLGDSWTSAVFDKSPLMAEFPKTPKSFRRILIIQSPLAQALQKSRQHGVSRNTSCYVAKCLPKTSGSDNSQLIASYHCWCVDWLPWPWQRAPTCHTTTEGPKSTSHATVGRHNATTHLRYEW